MRPRTWPEALPTFRAAVRSCLLAFLSALAAFLFAPHGFADQDPPAYFYGVVVPMVTPFDATGEHVDLEAMRRHVVWLLDKPVSLLFPISGLGQWRGLTLDEKKAVITTVVKAAGGRKPVAPGITSPDSLADTLALARFAEKSGAAAVSVAIPENLRPKTGSPSQEALFDFYKTVHDAVTLPVLIYDSQADLDPATALRLAALPRVKAIKYRTKNIVRFLAMTHAVGERLAVLAGVEHEGVAALAAGAAGIVGGGANIFPQLIDQVIQKFKRGDVAGARSATYALMDANDGVPGAQEIKYALAKYYGLPMTDRGRGDGYSPLTAKEQDALDVAMRRADPALAPGSEERSRLAGSLAKKRAIYTQLTSQTADADGFIHNKCDGVTFTALSCIARGLAAKDCPVYKAEDPQDRGRWFRHARHDCFALDGRPGGSRSNNSPDLFISLGLLFWHYRDLASVENVIAYGERHNWVMGDARESVRSDTVVWTEDLKALFYELRFRLGGADSLRRRGLSRRPDMGLGWQSHVAANRLLLVALLTGELRPDEVSALRRLVAREPHNGFYQALLARLTGADEIPALQLLLAGERFPPKALPDNHANQCAEYLFQRDELVDGKPNSAWSPCPDEELRRHSGTDFLWAACILTPGCVAGEVHLSSH